MYDKDIDKRTNQFFKELKKRLKEYPSTLEEWKQICNDFNNKVNGTFGYNIRTRMDKMAYLNNSLSHRTHMRGWYDEYDAFEDMYNCFFEELNDIYSDLEAEYNICTDPIWLWENDDRSKNLTLSIINDSIVPNKETRIVIYFNFDFSPIKVDLTVNDKSVL